MSKLASHGNSWACLTVMYLLQVNYIVKMQCLNRLPMVTAAKVRQWKRTLWCLNMDGQWKTAQRKCAFSRINYNTNQSPSLLFMYFWEGRGGGEVGLSKWLKIVTTVSFHTLPEDGFLWCIWTRQCWIWAYWNRDTLIYGIFDSRKSDCMLGFKYPVLTVYARMVWLTFV